MRVKHTTWFITAPHIHPSPPPSPSFLSLQISPSLIDTACDSGDSFPPTGKFLPFKVPLGPRYDAEIPDECRFNVGMLMAYVAGMEQRMGLVVDLTKTDRFMHAQPGCRGLTINLRLWTTWCTCRELNCTELISTYG